jgi:hypothetical protein
MEWLAPMQDLVELINEVVGINLVAGVFCFVLQGKHPGLEEGQPLLR